jgi:hypothetical protein
LNTERDLTEQIEAIKLRYKEDYWKMQEEINRLNKNLESLSGQTGYCLLCEEKARENERLREALEKLAPLIGSCLGRLRFSIPQDSKIIPIIQAALKSVEKPHQSVSAIDKKEGQV